jgi:hypothetical protein
VVVNDGDLVQLRAKVLDALEAIEHRPARDRTGQ